MVLGERYTVSMKQYLKLEPFYLKIFKETLVEKRGVVDENTPGESPAQEKTGCCKAPQPPVAKSCGCDSASHPQTRLEDTAVKECEKKASN